MGQEYQEVTTANLHWGKVSFWYDTGKRAIIYQIAFISILGLLGYYLFINIETNLQRQSIATGFGFLSKQSGFTITESFIPHSAASSYVHALIIGLLDTLEVSFIGIVLTLILGTLVGIARLSSNWLVSKLATIYIELLRDIPVLLQLFFWYSIFYQNLPSPRQALSPIAGLFLCNRGMFFPVPEFDRAYSYMALVFLAGSLAAFTLRRWSRKRQEKTGKLFPHIRISIGILVAEVANSAMDTESHFATKLRELESVKKERLITDEDYQKKRVEIMEEKW